MAAATQLAPWLACATADDMAWHGMAIGEDETPQTALQRLAAEMDVNLDEVEPCLKLLQAQPCMLLGGMPLAVMSYSPRLGCFRATFDGNDDADMHRLSDSRAGIWLALLSGEVGSLPATTDNWLIARLDAGQVLCPNGYAKRLADDYAQHAIKGGEAPDADPMAGFDRLMGQAIWRCARHRLR
ncbi:MAG: hypothetical protein RL223_542 [Pseudomonadota bacterium]|jgi:hypothetical protein